MKKYLIQVYVAFISLACVPLSQQQSSLQTPYPAEEFLIIQDELLYKELKYIIDNGINEPGEITAWEGPCDQNPVFKNRFQSGYSLHGTQGYTLSNHKVILNISHGGGCGCSQSIMAWDGKFATDKEGRKIAELVFSFKNLDFCRAIKHRSLVFDLKSLNFGSEEKIYIQINKYPQLVSYRPLEN